MARSIGSMSTRPLNAATVMSEVAAAPPRTLDRQAVARRAAGRRRDNSAVIYVVLMGLVVLFVGPFVWLVLAALKTPAEWVAVPTQILPEQPRWDNFVRALTD